mmetsp:Transcript_31636/g.69697  ORF Transcript_31636/g.69697 Transcript_31636/m.69697 type:complete len:264 (-) Transcript_31636:1483-2274(-)
MTEIFAADCIIGTMAGARTFRFDAVLQTEASEEILMRGLVSNEPFLLPLPDDRTTDGSTVLILREQRSGSILLTKYLGSGQRWRAFCYFILPILTPHFSPQDALLLLGDISIPPQMQIGNSYSEWSYLRDETIADASELVRGAAKEPLAWIVFMWVIFVLVQLLLQVLVRFLGSIKARKREYSSPQRFRSPARDTGTRSAGRSRSVRAYMSDRRRPIPYSTVQDWRALQAAIFGEDDSLFVEDQWPSPAARLHMHLTNNDPSP